MMPAVGHDKLQGQIAKPAVFFRKFTTAVGRGDQCPQRSAVLRKALGVYRRLFDSPVCPIILIDMCSYTQRYQLHCWVSQLASEYNYRK
jgi:hypothetical protein